VDGIVDWLNDNSGAVQAFVVLALVVVTATYAEFTRRMAREIREQRLAQDRPDLLIGLIQLLGWHQPEADADNRLLHTYPTAIDCRVHNAGRHAAKEVAITILHPDSLYEAKGEGFLPAGETWFVTIHADPWLQAASNRSPQGLSEWLAANAQRRQPPSGGSYDAGAVVSYRDVHDVAWATYLVLELIETRGGIKGEITDRVISTGRQRLIRLRQG